jgi:2-(1,2-epoxy-1,2-dihydrophenyl)acetyl-CoA isomerase
MVVLTERHGPVLVVTLNRPDRMNALNAEAVEALAAAWDEAKSPDVRAVVLTGAGRAFCAGADFRSAPDAPPPRAGGPRASYNPMLLALAALEKPIIAAVNGPAIGAGLALALAADIRLAQPEAMFIPGFTKIGAVPDTGTSWFAVRILGYPNALRWLASGSDMSVQQAHELGLVSEIYDGVELLDQAIALARTFTEVPGRASGLTKRLLSAALTNTLAAHLELEVELQDIAIADPGRAEAMAQLQAKLKTAK